MVNRNHLLITGGSGFIGRRLVRMLQQNLYEITVLSRNPGKTRRILPDGVTVVESLPPPEQRPWFGIINLAGHPIAGGRWTQAFKQRCIESRVSMTRQLEQWVTAMPKPPKVLINGSAVGYYGAWQEESLTESASCHDEFASQLCQAWEQAAFALVPLGVRVCAIRTCIVLGHGGTLEKMLTPFKLGLGGRFGSGKQWMSWINIDDWVDLVMFLLKYQQHEGVFNATAPVPVRNRDFAKTLGGALHRPAVMPMPAALLRLMFGEMAHIFLSGQKVIPMRAMQEGFQFRYPELKPALEELLITDQQEKPVCPISINKR